MNKWIFFPIIAFAAGTAAEAATQPTLLWCDSCTAPQKRAKAATQPFGTIVYVGDVNQDTFVAYSVDMMYDDAYSPPRQVKTVHAITPDSALQWIEDGLLAFYHAAPVGWQKSMVVDYPIAYDVNVYNVVAPGPAQNRMLDWAADSLGAWLNDVSVRTEQITSFFRLVDASKAPKITSTVRFADGSTIRIGVDYSATEAEFFVVDDSGRDSHHNTVLSRRRDTPVNFNFSGPGNPNDFASWNLWMQLLGYGVPVGPGAIWWCTSDPTFGLHCIHPL